MSVGQVDARVRCGPRQTLHLAMADEQRLRGTGDLGKPFSDLSGSHTDDARDVI